MEESLCDRQAQSPRTANSSQLELRLNLNVLNERCIYKNRLCEGVLSTLERLNKLTTSAFFKAARKDSTYFAGEHLFSDYQTSHTLCCLVYIMTQQTHLQNTSSQKLYRHVTLPKTLGDP